MSELKLEWREQDGCMEAERCGFDLLCVGDDVSGYLGSVVFGEDSPTPPVVARTQGKPLPTMRDCQAATEEALREFLRDALKSWMDVAAQEEMLARATHEAAALRIVVAALRERVAALEAALHSVAVAMTDDAAELYDVVRDAVKALGRNTSALDAIRAEARREGRDEGRAEERRLFDHIVAEVRVRASGDTQRTLTEILRRIEAVTP